MNKININHTDALLVENKLNKIHIHYPRPLRFSNPYNDFTIDELDEILLKNDSELNYKDFMIIFQSHCPAGTYKECLYFLPNALNYIIKNKLNNVDVCYNVINWISENKLSLLVDNFYETSLDLLCAFFCQMISVFEIHKDFPSNIDIVNTMLLTWNNLDNYNLLGDMLLENILYPFLTYHQASWACYLIYEHYTIYYKDNLSPLIASWCLDQKLKSHICSIILNNIIDNDDLLFFWGKIMSKCGML